MKAIMNGFMVVVVMWCGDANCGIVGEAVAVWRDREMVVVGMGGGCDMVHEVVEVWATAKFENVGPSLEATMVFYALIIVQMKNSRFRTPTYQMEVRESRLQAVCSCSNLVSWDPDYKQLVEKYYKTVVNQKFEFHHQEVNHQKSKFTIHNPYAVKEC
ncbi:hypothetical protein RHSIM_Rhsim03G0026100 [Rhododendron simsii]|uniref:Uncharacterized protein n=1 Tax=Rhododendron simsii TaxID=118357 RepID=A0A834H8B7_RHOSS|nr:hypothetical protein RHSIM_Rhsim03G0026100 [Rhododendron simsii]